MSHSSPNTFAGLFFRKQADAWAARYQSPTYRQPRQLVAEILRKEMLRLNRPAKSIRLLDFGCGSGVLLGDAADLGLQVTGVDNSEAMINSAREELSRFGEQINLERLKGSAGEGEYAQARYDIVFMPLGFRVYSGQSLNIVPPLRSGRGWRSVSGIRAKSQELPKTD